MNDQDVRELMVGLFLDINLGQWEMWADMVLRIPNSLTEQQDQLAGQVVQAMRTQADPESDVKQHGEARGQYLQAMCMMSDQTMRFFIEGVTGKPVPFVG